MIKIIDLIYFFYQLNHHKKKAKAGVIIKTNAVEVIIQALSPESKTSSVEEASGDVVILSMFVCS